MRVGLRVKPTCSEALRKLACDHPQFLHRDVGPVPADLRVEQARLAVMMGGLFYHAIAVLLSIGFVCIWILLRWAIARLCVRQPVDSDQRQAILYLRPFSVDKTIVSGKQALTVERTIALALSHVGPLLALGRPGDYTPPVGAVRMYATEANWRDYVEILIRKCRRIVVVLGNLGLLEYEVGRITTLGLLHKLIQLVPPLDEGARKLLWEEARQKLLPGLPPFRPGMIAAVYRSEESVLGLCVKCLGGKSNGLSLEHYVASLQHFMKYGNRLLSGGATRAEPMHGPDSQEHAL